MQAPDTCCGQSVINEKDHTGSRSVCLVCGASWFPFEIRPPTPSEIAETNRGWVDLEQYHDPDAVIWTKMRNRASVNDGSKKKGALRSLGRY